MEQQPPPPPPPLPQIKDEAAQKPTRAIFPSLICVCVCGWEERRGGGGGGGGCKFSIYFVQDCRRSGMLPQKFLN